jgi:hypothetical protein
MNLWGSKWIWGIDASVALTKIVTNHETTSDMFIGELAFVCSHDLGFSHVQIVIMIHGFLLKKKRRDSLFATMNPSLSRRRFEREKDVIVTWTYWKHMLYQEP